jgi:arsenite methyltransferase
VRKSWLDILVDPVSKACLWLKDERCGADGDVLDGVLRSPDGKLYPISNGIPRFVRTDDSDQKQTERSFGFKWQQRDTYESPRVSGTAQAWLVQRYGFRSLHDMRRFFSQRRRVLDAGCGSGFSTSLWMDEFWRDGGSAEWFGVDISAAIDVARERLVGIEGVRLIQADIMQLPFAERTFDTIFSEGALHHTPSTERALKSLIPLLEPGGQILFYVYRKKGPIREFTDDYIRGSVSSLDPQEAWELLRPLTRLGQALAELHVEFDVPEEIPYLGIKAGRYDIQRFIYWHFAKLFWNEQLSLEENHHVNFDWYHPRYAHRQSSDEVRRWCEEAGLSIIHFDAQESGFTIRGIKG